jgi:hypothetical protein
MNVCRVRSPVYDVTTISIVKNAIKVGLSPMAFANKIIASNNNLHRMEFVMIVKNSVLSVSIKHNAFNARKDIRINLGFVFSFVAKDSLGIQS